MATTHRLRQGFKALLSFSKPVDFDLAADYLRPDQMALFQRMRRSEQLHSLNVLRALINQNDSIIPDLCVAALLHDVGKSRFPLTISEKSLAVIIRAILPGLYRHWSQGSPNVWWQRAFVVTEQHPAWSAEMVAATGASDRALWLIRHHADSIDIHTGHPHAHLLKRFQEADDTN